MYHIPYIAYHPRYTTHHSPHTLYARASSVVQICDFGLAHVYEKEADGKLKSRELLKDVCGSKSYAAPEVRQRPHVDWVGVWEVCGGLSPDRAERSRVGALYTPRASECELQVLAGRGYDGFAADVWSCGICLFAMLSGFFPLDGAIVCNRMQSYAIVCNRMQSDAIRRNQMQSDAIRCNQMGRCSRDSPH